MVKGLGTVRDRPPPSLRVFVFYLCVLFVSLLCLAAETTSGLALPAFSSPVSIAKRGGRASRRSSALNMGLLKTGKAMKWHESKSNLSYVRDSGVKQFLSTYNRVKSLRGDDLVWGDEVEYGVFCVKNGELKMSLRAKEIMDELNSQESQHLEMTEGCNWVPEYGAWMVEATPSRPYTAYTSDLLRVERNMRLRRKRLLSALKEHEVAPTVSSYPLLGAKHVPRQTFPPSDGVNGPYSDSDYVSDAIINPHPRFGTLTQNIRARRGSKVCIKVPLFHDTETPEYKGYGPPNDDGGTCGGGGTKVWSYGMDSEEDKDHVIVDCSQNVIEGNPRSPVTLCKYLVKVEGCLGLYYRSSPGIVVADVDWPRNGDIVVGVEVPDQPGWVRLQNGYYLPMRSEDGNTDFLIKQDSATSSTNDGMDRSGYPSPSLRPSSFKESTLSKIPEMSLDEDDDDADCGMPSSFDQSTASGVVPAIHMDAMAFGMGCCCVQVTFQAKDIDESRFMYDQLAVLSPILMALTASTPILKGRIADTDCRWGIISAAVDDRTKMERGFVSPAEDGEDSDPDMAGKAKRRLYKSRYDSISTYIYQGACQPNSDCASASSFSNRILNKYNDLAVPIDEEYYLMLRSKGVDPALAQHVAHLFIRDPLVVFEGSVEEVDDATQTEHFESIQSTNWQSVRWKPPPPRLTPNDPHIGWRVEFRTMEVQLTDFENAAFTVFVVLLTRAILAFDLNLYLPLSRVDANMQRAHSRDAARRGKFFFRRHLAPLEEGDEGYGDSYEPAHSKSSKGGPCAEDDDGISNNR